MWLLVSGFSIGKIILIPYFSLALANTSMGASLMAWVEYDNELGLKCGFFLIALFM